MLHRAIHRVVLGWGALAGILVASLAWAPPAFSAGPAQGRAADQAQAGIERAIAVQNRHTDGLLEHEDVVGTAIGLDRQGQPVIRIFVAERRAVRDMPRQLNGVDVEVSVTGPIEALGNPRPVHHRPDHAGGPGGGNGGDNGDDGGNGDDDGGGDEPPPPENLEELLGTPRFFPIGISTGNGFECSAGTVGCRLVKVSPSGQVDVFALSNNHVYARQNAADLLEPIVIPGTFDTFDDNGNRCHFNEDNVIGVLWDYEPIRYGGGRHSRNYIDAAIAWTTAGHLDNSTNDWGIHDYNGPEGYGIPNSEIKEAALGDKVQMYGRNTITAMPTGTVTSINATVRVPFSGGQAWFDEQIIVEGTNVARPGDSGSLFVTDDENVHPVGLLFAGGSGGNLAVANRIARVLERFDAAVDDGFVTEEANGD